MMESEPALQVDCSYETLARLHDNPGEKIDELQSFQPDSSTIKRQQRAFQALANEDRLRLLDALADGEKCGCELEIVLDAPQSTVATHLRRLRGAGIVKRRRKGKWSFYRIADSAVVLILDLVAAMEDK